MAQPITTILLAPSGTGKTTRIERMREAGLKFVHINRDGITGDLFREHSIDPRRPLTQDDREGIYPLLEIGEQRYYESLERGFAAGTPHIVIDYPPGGSKKWIPHTIALSKQAGRKIIVEGLLADPLITLPRVLQRNSKGLDLSSGGLEMMNPDRKYFMSWLGTYRTFPERFLEAAEAADEAHLYDTNLNDPRLIADWHNGQLFIKDETAFKSFRDLSLINPETARFDAKVTDTQIVNGIPFHSFAVSTSGFDGLNHSDVPTFSCDINSRNLSPLVDYLEKMIRERTSKGPIVVLVSEVHSVASHVILPLLLMERFQSSSDLKVALGIEKSHDLLDRLTECQTNVPIPADEWGQLSANDRDGRLLVGAYLQTALTPAIRKSRKGILKVALPACHQRLMEYVRQNDISVRAVDAAGSPDGQGFLDITSCSTRKIIEKFAPHLMGEQIFGTNCIWLRNEHAGESVIAHIKHSGADVYILPYGGAHLSGWKAQPDQGMPVEHSADQSLNAVFERAGINTMTVFMSFQDKFVPQNIPDNANPKWMENGIIVTGINPSEFWQDPKNSLDINLRIGQEERKFLADVLEQSGSLFVAAGPGRPATSHVKQARNRRPGGTGS